MCNVPDVGGSEPMKMNPSYKRVVIGKGPSPQEFWAFWYLLFNVPCFSVAMLPVRYVTARAVS